MIAFGAPAQTHAPGGCMHADRVGIDKRFSLDSGLIGPQFCIIFVALSPRCALAEYA